eukprot:2384316-Rhodomonas_salina.1
MASGAMLGNQQQAAATLSQPAVAAMPPPAGPPPPLHQNLAQMQTPLTQQQFQTPVSQSGSATSNEASRKDTSANPEAHSVEFDPLNPAKAMIEIFAK